MTQQISHHNYLGNILWLVYNKSDVTFIIIYHLNKIVNLIIVII